MLLMGYVLPMLLFFFFLIVTAVIQQLMDGSQRGLFC